jgi:ParB-like chromosome segregation protein Spo0J
MELHPKVLEYIAKLGDLPVSERVPMINALRQAIHKVSPFNKEPVDCVMWVPKDSVKGNDYNPNSVAPPEMQLLEVSIEEDGYTQPIVAWSTDAGYEIVDGFHRHRVGKECKDISERIHGYLPLTLINAEKSGKDDRIASTIRHNRARGKHSVDAMTEIVIELKKRNWTKEKIAKHLGMDADEILRLTQISGLVEMFKDAQFSDSWNINLDELYMDPETEGGITDDPDADDDEEAAG